MKIKQTVALGIMGCFLFSSTAFAAPTLAEPTITAKQQDLAIAANADRNDVAVKESVLITTEKIQKKNSILEIDIAYPVISGLTDVNFQKQLNDYIKKQVTTAKDEIQMQAEEYAREAKKNGWEVRPYQLSIDYDLKTNDEDFLSLTITYYTYTGGANGMTVVGSINIDKKANKSIQLKDLFPAGTDFKTKINNEIVKQIEMRSKDKEEIFFEGDMAFKSISDSQGFYLKDNDIVIIFPQYEIAPGAMGIPEFAINLAELKDSLAVIDEGKIVIEGLEIKTFFDRENKVVMIPLRQTGEKLGYTVTWKGDDRSVLLTKGNASAKLKIGDNIYIANHKIPYILEAPPVIVNDYTYVPVSFLEKVLLYKI
ncbi:Domain of unknown function DUF4163 [Syntrophomonas zehnderi OL-4]|uniref:Copper amine oxidase-like, N-terminal n=1 Tax=Syntrophomonas zehnderi OL-4 TaxID=690567 RepID=A0A0E4GFE6_9FIRM|nr:DUF4163 domain-containing protein [Syntrophomonas zehnderi]CFY08248.1 Domain of unknown function DUF4163 [Syntrophomonas zehnderi OL-4]